MISWWHFLILAVVMCFAFVCFFGAPFVPTRKRWAEQALNLVKFNERDLVVDLGSGSGTILKLLARRGVRSIGYELNPIMWLISKVRFLTTDLASVKFGNFWRQDLPKNTTLVYVFAVVRDAEKLEKYLAKQAKGRKLKVITFGFKLPTKKVVKHTKGAFLYQF
jgi:SAM-dependent methyltransferase